MPKSFTIKLHTHQGEEGLLVRITPPGKNILRRADSDVIKIRNDSKTPITVFAPSNSPTLFNPVPPAKFTLAHNDELEWNVRPMSELPNLNGVLSQDASFSIRTEPRRDTDQDHADVHWDC